MVRAGFEATLADRGYQLTEYGTYRLETPGDSRKAAEMMALRDLGIAFSVGPGWPPASIFELFREKGLVHGTFKQIGWSAPGIFEIIEN